MLSQKDLEKIRQIIKEELTIKDIAFERINKEGVKEFKVVDLYLPEWIARELPDLALALRGVQETADHAKNNSFKVFNGFGHLVEAIETSLNRSNETIKRLISSDADLVEIENNE